MKCKFCDEEMNNSTKELSCLCQCGIYRYSMSNKDELESELIINGNYYLVYLNKYKEVNIIENGKQGRKVVLSFSLDELDSKTAKHWYNKLKTYVLFQ